MVVEEDEDGNYIVGRDVEPKWRTPNPRIELPYIYLMVWYVMHCSSLMSVV